MADRLVGSDTDDDPHTSSSHRLSRSGSKNNRSTYVSFADESESVSPSAVSSAKTGRRRRFAIMNLLLNITTHSFYNTCHYLFIYLSEWYFIVGASLSADWMKLKVTSRSRAAKLHRP